MIVDKKCPYRHGSLLSAPRRIRSRLSAAHGPDKRTCPRKQVGVPRPAHRNSRSAIAITHPPAQLPPKRAPGAPGHPPPPTPAIPPHTPPPPPPHLPPPPTPPPP